MSERRRGRPPVKRKQSEEILPNGLFLRQWQRIQKDAKEMGTDAAKLLRRIVDQHYALVDRDASGSTATPSDDKKFENLIQQNLQGDNNV